MDAFKNFAKVQVSTGYDASATSIALTAGHGARLPAPPFNATWWNSTDYPDPSDDPNVEIVRVTAIASDTLTVTRAQESTSASVKNTASKTYRMIAGLTAKTFNTDVAMGLVVQVINGRLTLQSGVPISTTDQTVKTTIYFTPFNGNCISLYSDPMWVCYQFSELSLALGTLTADKNYDVFIYDNAGTLTLELGAAWTSDIARADALVLQDGVYVKSGATTRRYLGTFRTTTTTTTEDSQVKRLLWNYHNRMTRDLYRVDTTVHAYAATNVMRQWNNDLANQVVFVVGIAEDTTVANLAGLAFGTAPNIWPIFGVGFDSVTESYRGALSSNNVTTTAANGHVSVATIISPQIGYHRITALEDNASGISVDFHRIDLTAGVRA